MSIEPIRAPALKLYTIPEAAELLHVPEGWLRKKVSAGAVPHTRLGKHVRFTDEHLLRIVEQGESEPVSIPIATSQGLSARSRRSA
jgi:excisionase family DNA binding protein